MWFVNQAALGTWYAQNNIDIWRTYLTVMYNIVNFGLGASVQDFYVFEKMQINYFPDANGINTNLLISNPITDPAVLDIVYTDPYYGL
jgi:hypothetical protein